MALVKYPYKDPKQMSAFKIIKEGDGYFKVTNVKESVSKAGNQQLEITYMLKDCDGNTTLYIQYLQHNEYLPENIYRICEAAGKAHLYSERGTDTNDLLGLKGACKIKTEAGTGSYSDKSRIHRFIPYKPMLESEDYQHTQEDIPDDEVPF